MSSSSASKATSEDIRTVRLAAILRTKYHDPSFPGLTRIDPRELAPDPFNRKGNFPQKSRVLSLCTNILALGTDMEEPQGGAVIRQPPASTRLYDFVAKNCGQDSGFPLPEKNRLQFGTLEHSHYTMILRCFLYAVEGDIAGVSVRGKLCMERLRDVDHNMWHHCQGIRCEVLAPNILTEEPDGADIISKASNAKQKLGMSETEQEVLDTIRELCYKSIAAGSQASRVSIMQKVMATLPCDLADVGGFLDFICLQVGSKMPNTVEKEDKPVALADVAVDVLEVQGAAGRETWAHWF
jgi:hypothetical protein